MQKGMLPKIGLDLLPILPTNSSKLQDRRWEQDCAKVLKRTGASNIRQHSNPLHKGVNGVYMAPTTRLKTSNKGASPN
jgi:hypothetical protein